MTNYNPQLQAYYKEPKTSVPAPAQEEHPPTNTNARVANILRAPKTQAVPVALKLDDELSAYIGEPVREDISSLQYWQVSQIHSVTIQSNTIF
jgi:hypothetical protein